MIYLATPYSDPDPLVMERRFDEACRYAGALMARGELVFCPIAHTHPIAVRCELPRGWEFWQRYDRAMLTAARKLIVVKMDGCDYEIFIARCSGRSLARMVNQARDCKFHVLSPPPAFMELEDLQICRRAYNVLKWHGLTTLEQICQLTAVDFLRFKNAGVLSLRDLREELDRIGAPHLLGTEPVAAPRICAGCEMPETNCCCG